MESVADIDGGRGIASIHIMETSLIRVNYRCISHYFTVTIIVVK